MNVHTTKKIFISLFLVIITGAVYARSNWYGFAYMDDFQYVITNSFVQSGLSAKSFAWSFTTAHANNWHPLTWLSLMLDFELWGMNPAGYHLSNLFFHLANSVLLFLVFVRMTGSTWRSAFVAAIFALHPLHVESVVWISERKDVLFAFFWILTMWTYVRYTESPGIKRYLPVFVFFSLGLLSKPMIVTLPFVLLLLDVWPLGRISFDGQSGESGRGSGRAEFLNSCKKAALEKIPLFIVAAASGGITFFIQQQSGGLKSLEALPLWMRLCNGFKSYVFYIIDTLWPTKLAVIYSYTIVESTLIWHAALSAVLIVLISVAVLCNIRKRPYLPVGWFWFVGTLVPVIGLIQTGMHSRADRYMYVPLIGLSIIAAWGAFEALKDWRLKNRALAVAAVIVLFFFSILTYYQAGYWRSHLTLFEHALNVTDNNYIAHTLFADNLLEQGRIDEAAAHYKEAINIDPLYMRPRIGLGKSLLKKGRLKAAEAELKEAVRLVPEDARSHFTLGVVLAARGRTNEAVEQYKAATSLRPDYVEAYNNLAVIYTDAGLYDLSITQLGRAIELDKQNPALYYNMAIANDRKGDRGEAIRFYLMALEVSPGYAHAEERLKALGQR